MHTAKPARVTALCRRAQALPCPALPTPLPAGQRVTGAPFPARAGNGTWQQYIVVEEGALLAVPDKVSDEAAAQFLVRPWVVCSAVQSRVFGGGGGGGVWGGGLMCHRNALN